MKPKIILVILALLLLSGVSLATETVFTITLNSGDCSTSGYVDWGACGGSSGYGLYNDHGDVGNASATYVKCPIDDSDISSGSSITAGSTINSIAVNPINAGSYVQDANAKADWYFNGYQMRDNDNLDGNPSCGASDHPPEMSGDTSDYYIGGTNDLWIFKQGGAYYILENANVEVTVDWTVSDTCTYGGSGNWNVDCADNCSITTNTNVVGDIILNGEGHFEILADITADSIAIPKGCEVRNIPNDGNELAIKG